MSGGEPALPVDVEVGRHGRLTVVAEASGNVVLVDRGHDDEGRTQRKHTLTDVERLRHDLLTALIVARTQDPEVRESYREALP